MSVAQSTVIAAAFGVVIGLLHSAVAQDVGNYREVLANDKEVAKVTAFAIDAKNKASKEKIKLVKIVKAETQVVAGRNYRLTLDVACDEKPRRAVVVVWAKLDGTLELTNWTWPADTKEKVEPKPK